MSSPQIISATNPLNSRERTPPLAGNFTLPCALPISRATTMRWWRVVVGGRRGGVWRGMEGEEEEGVTTEEEYTLSMALLLHNP